MDSSRLIGALFQAASKVNFQELIRAGDNIILMPGGFEEATFAPCWLDSSVIRGVHMKSFNAMESPERYYIIPVLFG
ncbi:unnamed protein product [Aphanomyces euteiches]